jgi:hypothetical protein
MRSLLTIFSMKMRYPDLMGAEWDSHFPIIVFVKGVHMFPAAKEEGKEYVYLKGGLVVGAWDIDTEDKDKK